MPTHGATTRGTSPARLDRDAAAARPAPVWPVTEGRGRSMGVLLFVAATAFSLAAFAKVYRTDFRPNDEALSVGQLILVRVPLWFGWLLLAPAIVWLGRRVRIDGPRRARATLAHLAASVGVALAHILIVVVINTFVLHFPATLASIAHRFGTRVNAIIEFEVLAYWAILGLSYAFEYARGMRERDLLAARLESQLANARLNALEAQLHPHFLFNTLNTIAVLMRDGQAPAAVGVVTALGDLLRRSLSAGDGTQLVPLRQELDFVNAYLAIERVRFGGRLTVRVNVAPEVLAAPVPKFLLQPLVENALRHGLATRAGGVIEIAAARDGDALRIEVADDGAGLAGAGRAGDGFGIGLSITRERLRQLYSDDHHFAVSDRHPSGALATVLLPLPGMGPTLGA